MCECWGEGGEENETYTQHTHKYTHTHYINSPRSQLGIMKFVSAVTQKLLLWQWHLGISANIRNIQTTWQWQVSIWDFHKLMWQLLKFSQRAGPKCWGQHQMPVTANDQSSQCWESRGRAPDTMISNFFFSYFQTKPPDSVHKLYYASESKTVLLDKIFWPFNSDVISRVMVP